MRHRFQAFIGCRAGRRWVPSRAGGAGGLESPGPRWRVVDLTPASVGRITLMFGWWSNSTCRSRPHGPIGPRPKLPTATIVVSSRAPDARAWPSATSSAQEPPVKWWRLMPPYMRRRLHAPPRPRCACRPHRRCSRPRSAGRTRSACGRHRSAPAWGAHRESVPTRLARRATSAPERGGTVVAGIPAGADRCPTHARPATRRQAHGLGLPMIPSGRRGSGTGREMPAARAWRRDPLGGPACWGASVLGCPPGEHVAAGRSVRR